MELRWTPGRAQHIAHRSDRYPEATDIDTSWTDEAVNDPRKLGPEAGTGARAGTLRIVGYSPTAGFVITVITMSIDGIAWGVTAWKTSGAERRKYWEANDDRTQ